MSRPLDPDVLALVRGLHAPGVALLAAGVAALLGVICLLVGGAFDYMRSKVVRPDDRRVDAAFAAEARRRSTAAVVVPFPTRRAS